MVKQNPPALQEVQETRVQPLGWEDPLEEEMETQVFLLGRALRQNSSRAIVHGVTKSQTQLSE